MFLDIDGFDRTHIAIHDDGGTVVTYGELCDFVQAVAECKLKRGIVFTLCENEAGALAGYAAFESCKLVPLLMSADIDKNLLDNLDKTYEPQYYWVKETEESRFKGEKIYSGLGYCLIRTGHDFYEINDKLSLLMMTSGSTGSPKLVRYKYGNLEKNALNVAKVFGWTSKENCIMDLPMQYTMGLNVINSHLCVGATVLLIKSNLMSAAFWDFIRENHGTNFTGVPYSYEIMLKLRFTRMKLPDLYTLAEGGGKLTDDVFKTLADYAVQNDKRFCATFGTTETSARMAFLDPAEAVNRTGSIGKAIPGGRLYLVDEEGAELKEEEARGELCYDGPNVTMGYGICKADLLKDDEWNGTYHTGDIAKRDKDGFYYIVGRKSRFLKLYGLRISLDQAERVIKSEYDCECACSGNDKEMYIYVTDGEIAKELPGFLSKKFNIIASTFRTRVVEQILKNSTGKIMYKKMDESWENDGQQA